MSYIGWNDVYDVFILNKVVHLDEYDMCYVKFEMYDGTSKVVRVFCDKGSALELESGSIERWEEVKDWEGDLNSGIMVPDSGFHRHRLKQYLSEDLIGEEGLMNEQGRDDFIYLGNYNAHRRWHDDRYNKVNGGKTKQQVFEDNLFRLKLQVQAREGQQVSSRGINSASAQYQEQSSYRSTAPTQKSNGKGKHYAISDVHGMYDSYDEAMKRMHPNDHLYIIGDVIDRGSEGIRILQDIIRRKNDPHNNPEITFLLGNHEMQFLDAIKMMLSKGLSSDEMRIIIKEGNNQIIDTQKRLNKYEIGDLYRWIKMDAGGNKGMQTFLDYLKLPQEEQEELIKFLVQSYVSLPQKINGEDYLFVHAMPTNNSELLRIMKESGKGVTAQDYAKGINKSLYRFMLGERKKETYEKAKAIGFTTICGHTPTCGEIEENDDKGFIRIDAGCGHRRKEETRLTWEFFNKETGRTEIREVVYKPSKLALYCIDDGSVEYIDEIETIQEQKNVETDSHSGH